MTAQPSEREARARAALCEDVWLSIPAYLHKSIIKASLAFADRERADEREAAAKVADAGLSLHRPVHSKDWNDAYETACNYIAAAIRNRKDEM